MLNNFKSLVSATVLLTVIYVTCFGRSVLFMRPTKSGALHVFRQKHWETNIACAAAPPQPSEVQRFHSWHDLGVMGMTHPSHTPPHPSSMTPIAGYTTTRTESAARHPHTHPPTGAAHTHIVHSPCSLSLHPEYTQNNAEIFPGFLLPAVHLTLGKKSRSLDKGSVEITHNVSKWKSAVWLWEGVGKGNEYNKLFYLLGFFYDFFDT